MITLEGGSVSKPEEGDTVLHNHNTFITSQKTTTSLLSSNIHIHYKCFKNIQHFKIVNKTLFLAFFGGSGIQSNQTSHTGFGQSAYHFSSPPHPFTLTIEEKRIERARLLRHCRDIWPKGTNLSHSHIPHGEESLLGSWD